MSDLTEEELAGVEDRITPIDNGYLIKRLANEIRRRRAAQTASADVRAVVLAAVVLETRPNTVDRWVTCDAIADRVAAQIVSERPVALSAGDLKVIDGALDFWLRRGGTAPREDIVRIRATLITGTPSAGPIQPSTAPLPSHVCPAPYALGPEDLDALEELAAGTRLTGWPRACTAVRKVLAAHTCPEPTIEPLPEVIQCGTPGCVSSIKKTYLPSGWRLTAGVWACPRCKVLATTEAS